MAKDINMTMALFMAQDAKCFYCACEFDGRVPRRASRPRAWTKDHVKPACKGHTTLRNCVLACLACNRAKRDRDPTRQELARARNVWADAVRYLKAFNGMAPPALSQA